MTSVIKGHVLKEVAPTSYLFFMGKRVSLRKVNLFCKTLISSLKFTQKTLTLAYAKLMISFTNPMDL